MKGLLGTVFICTAISFGCSGEISGSGSSAGNGGENGGGDNQPQPENSEIEWVTQPATEVENQSRLPGLFVRIIL